eukprot:3929382-Amphidinium_carterae.2
MLGELAQQIANMATGPCWEIWQDGARDALGVEEQASLGCAHQHRNGDRNNLDRMPERAVYNKLICSSSRTVLAPKEQRVAELKWRAVRDLLLQIAANEEMTEACKALSQLSDALRKAKDDVKRHLGNAERARKPAPRPVS